LKPNVKRHESVTSIPKAVRAGDAGFSVFYMGINVGAMIGPLICSYFGEKSTGIWDLPLLVSVWCWGSFNTRWVQSIWATLVSCAASVRNSAAKRLAWPAKEFWQLL